MPDRVSPSRRDLMLAGGLRPADRRVGFAVLGLGRLALEQILPAVAQAKRARLVALVSGSPDKAATVAAQYGLPRSAVYGYDTMDRLRDDPAVQVVYVVTPNALHAEHAAAAFAAASTRWARR